MSEEKFSILMANYNNGRYISEAIESLLQQTYDNWELVIVDDRSDDDSVEIIKKYLGDQRIKLFIHDKHLGCGATKRDCAVAASGEIFGELDPDDALSKNALDIIVKAYQDDPDYGFIYSNLYKCDERLNPKGKYDWVGGINSLKTNLIEWRASHFRTFKRSAYMQTSGYDPDLKSAVDKDIIYKLEEVTKLKYIDKLLYFYRKNKDGISQERNAASALVYDKIAKYNAYKRRLQTKVPSLSRNEMSTELLLGCIPCMKVKNFQKAFYFLRESMKIFPFNFSGYFMLCWRLIKFPFYRLLRRVYPAIEKIYD
jgi:glycosyltransferase involved in cell wall biosynthesis